MKETFFSWDDAKASFPDVIKGFGLNVLLFLIAEPLILVLGRAGRGGPLHDVRRRCSRSGCWPSSTPTCSAGYRPCWW